MPNKHLPKDEALARLREVLSPGQKIYTILRHVSASGMSRVIDVLYIDQTDLEPMRISHLVAAVSGYRLDDRHEGLKVSGAGMDMGFEVVYTLGEIMWPDGTPEPHGTLNGQPDRAGGYALKQRWL